MSVLEPGTVVSEAWRPPASDPRWGPDYSKGTTTDHLDPTPAGVLPDLAVGPHQLVVSLLGSYDTPSYAPDGTIATDLLSRCSTELNVTSATSKVSVLVTFSPDPQSFGGTCTLAVVP